MLKEAFRAWLAERSPEAAARVVAEAKSQVWVEFGENMEKDFRSTSKKFWHTVRRLRKGKHGSAQAGLSGGVNC